MSDASSSADRAPIERLAEEFVARFRNGEHPPLSEFTARHPELAEQIKELFPALVMMEQFKPATADHTGSFASNLPGPNGTPLERIGDYRILREVGRGGMGVVYEAEQVSLGRHVALKVLTGQTRLDPRHLARFEREARAAARLHHTNIVPVYGVGSDEGLHYYVMQYIAGMGLDAVLAEMRRANPKGTLANGTASVSVEDVARALNSDRPESTPVSLPGQSSAPSNRSDTGRAYWQSVARVGVQVAEALHYAHQHGVLHRDVKPSNLLLDGQGVVWVTDFGLAKADDSADLTQTGDIVGTLRYLAPERFNGQGDVRSDIYSLGLTLYELLALRPAFDAPDRNRLIRQVTDAEPPRLRKVVPGLPRDLETIVHKATARDPHDRYATAQEMAADLRRFVEDRPIQARRVSTTERFARWCRRNPVVAGLSGGVVAALVAIAVVSTVLALQMAASADAARAAQRQTDQDKKTLEEAAAKQNQLVDQQQALLGQQYVGNGVRSLEAGDYGEAALWFAQALDRDGANPERAAMHRTRLSNTLRACPRPLHVWFDDGPTFAQYSADGRLVLSSSGRTVRLRDAATGEDVVAPLEHDRQVSTAVFSRNGSRVVTYCGSLDPNQSDEFFVRVWDTHSGKPLTPPLRFGRGKGSASRGPFGNYAVNVLPSAEADRVVVSADGKSFQVWDVAAGKFLGDPIAPADPKAVLMELKLSPDGCRVLATSTALPSGPRGPAGPNTAVSGLWEAGRPDLVGEQWERSKGPMGVTTFSRDGRRLFLHSRNELECRDCETGRLLWSSPNGYQPGATYVESPDGAWVFQKTGRGDAGDCHILDARTGEPLAGSEKIAFSGMSNTRAVWSADSKLLLESSEGSPLRVWDAKTFMAIGVPFRPNDLQYQMTSFSPDGQRLLTVYGNNTVRVWDILTGLPVTPAFTHAEPVRSAQFSPSGMEVLTASGSAVYVWPLAAPPHGRTINSDAVSISIGGHSQDNRWVFLHTYPEAGLKDEQVELYHCPTGKHVPLMTVPTSPAGSFSFTPTEFFSPDARFALSTRRTGGTEGGSTRVHLWETATGRQLADFREAGDVSAVFRSDGKQILLQRTTLADRLGTVQVSGYHLLDPERIEAAGPWCKLDVPLTDRSQFGFGSGRGSYGLQFGYDGSRLLHEGTTKVLDAATGRVVGDFGPDEATRNAGWQFLALTPDRRFALWMSAAGQFQRRDAEMGAPAGPVMRMEDGAEWSYLALMLTGGVAFNADGSRFAVSPRRGPNVGVFQVWDAVAGKPLTPLLSQPGRIRQMTFSPDGGLLLTADDSGTVRVWETATGEQAIAPLTHFGPVSVARFDRDGKRILTVSSRSRDGARPGGGVRGSNEQYEFQVWETATGRPLTPPLPCQGVAALFWGKADGDTVFDPEGAMALRSYAEGVLEVTDLTADELSLAEQRTMAEVWSGRRLNAAGRLLPLEERRFRDGWQSLEERAWPPEARALLDPVWWHRRQAALASAWQTQGLPGRPVSTRVNADAAVWHLDRLLALKPGDTNALRLRATRYAELQHWPEALADYTALTKDFPAYHLERGNINAQMGNWKDAEADFNRAVKEPLFAKTDALEALALVRLRGGDRPGWQEACTSLLAELKGQEPRGEGVLALTAAPGGLADWRFLDKRQDTGPEGGPGGFMQADPFAIGAMLYRQGGHDEEALRLLNSTITWSRVTTADAAFFRALIFQRMGKAEQAAAALKSGREYVKSPAATGAGGAWDLSAKWKNRTYTELLEREAAKGIEGK